MLSLSCARVVLRLVLCWDCVVIVLFSKCVFSDVVPMVSLGCFYSGAVVSRCCSEGVPELVLGFSYVVIALFGRCLSLVVVVLCLCCPYVNPMLILCFLVLLQWCPRVVPMLLLDCVCVVLELFLWCVGILIGL